MDPWGSGVHNPLSKHLSEIIDLRTPVRTLRPLEEDNNMGMQTSYVGLLNVMVTLLIYRLTPTRDGDDSSDTNWCPKSK